MIRAMDRHNAHLLLLVLGASIGLSDLLRAQPLPSPAALPVAVAGKDLPPTPLSKSPVDQFRELLALSPAERESHLTNRPPEIRQRILAKLQEYDSLKPDERELRLRNTQLRWYLLSMMETAPSARNAQFATIPDSDRQFVKDHLEQWDRLPVAEQTEILKYEKVIENLLAHGFTNAASTTNIIAPPPLPMNENSLSTFLRLPEGQRQQMYLSFQKFFELSDAERQNTLGILPPAERQQMNVALEKFVRLPKPQRELCLDSFNKFSSMSEAERQEFLKNAERWRELPPAERQAWRELVNSLPANPPLPPVMVPPPPLPPMPPRLSVEASVVPPTNSSP